MQCDPLRSIKRLNPRQRWKRSWKIGYGREKIWSRSWTKGKLPKLRQNEILAS